MMMLGNNRVVVKRRLIAVGENLFRILCTSDPKRNADLTLDPPIKDATQGIEKKRWFLEFLP